jgi:hypothetical protein
MKAYKSQATARLTIEKSFSHFLDIQSIKSSVLINLISSRRLRRWLVSVIRTRHIEMNKDSRTRSSEASLIRRKLDFSSSFCRRPLSICLPLLLASPVPPMPDKLYTFALVADDLECESRLVQGTYAFYAASRSRSSLFFLPRSYSSSPPSVFLCIYLRSFLPSRLFTTV